MTWWKRDRGDDGRQGDALPVEELYALPAYGEDDQDAAWRRPGGEVVETRPAEVAGTADTLPAVDDRVTVEGHYLDRDPVELVDDPGQDVPWSARETQPVLPPWLESREAARGAALWAAGHAGHVVAFHTLRLPVYAARLALRAPIGAALLAGRGLRWWLDAEGIPVRMDAVRRLDAAEYLKLTDRRDDRVRWRTTVAAVVIALATLGFAAWRWLLPEPAAWAVAVVVVVVLGLVGTPRDRPVIGRAVVPTQAVRLTSDHIVRALGGLGLAEVNKALAKGGAGIGFPSPITRDGPGWRADVDLPVGVTPGDVVERRDRLASGLRRPLGCVWPEQGDEHAGRLVLWVGDKDMATAKAPPWPLAKTGRADLFAPVPFGHDQRGRLVTVPLMFASVLVGAMPRMGKTFALRVLLLAAALDPTAELRVHELKGSGDLSPLEPVAHRYGSGADDQTIADTVASLREVYAMLETRPKTVSGLSREDAPEGKVTPVTSARRSLRLWPVVIAVDECQELFAHPEHGAEAERLCMAIIRRGPAYGLILLLATQRPDKDSLPTGISANVGVRFCLRVMGQVENDMILGTSAYKSGLRATTFSAKRDLGIGYLVGASPDPQVVRSAYLDAAAADRVVLRARALREAAGTLSGHAVGDPAEERTDRDVLGDVARVLGTDDAAWSEVLCERLAALNPAAYSGWEPATLAAALKAQDVATVQLARRDDDGAERNRRGVRREHVVEAIARRGLPPAT